MERRVVTILFADLAGSTALGERLDPEDVRALQTELFRLANLEVERFGGITEKFVGDAILAVFGIPQAHEDDAERAVRAGLAIQQRFGSFAARVSDAHAAEVGLRIGIATGEVVAGREAAARGELMVTGDAVNVAARLQQLAEPGEVLVGERTKLATQRVVSYVDRGALAAKGKAQPLRAWAATELTGLSGRAGAGSAFVGRADELAVLRLEADRVARERRPELVTVFGNAGVGKSRLVAEFVAGLEDALVLTGRCVPYGDGITYLPLAEVVAGFAGIRDDEPAASALRKLEAVVARTVPEAQRQEVLEAVRWTLGLSLPGYSAAFGVPGDARRALHEGWTAFLTALGRQALVVLVVEDVHWASEPLIELLTEVLSGLEDTAVLVVCPSRPELLDTRPDWGTGRLAASSVSLAPLGDDESQLLLQDVLGPGASSVEVAPRILGRAEGNPFYVEELVAMLVEQGAIEEQAGRWVETDRLALTDVPDSIHGVIAARLDLLESREREALRRCSVMGRVFWPSAVQVDDDIVATLGRRAIVSESAESAFTGRREFTFKHALTHEVAYTTLPRGERGALHHRVAEWLSGVAPERRAETVELVAFHYDQALLWSVHDDELRRAAFSATFDAGDAAVRRGAYATAGRLLERALELAQTRTERSPAAMLAAQIDIHESRYEDALARLAAVASESEEASDTSTLADVLGLRARASWLAGRWDGAREAAEAAVATLEGLPESAELARALARLSQIQMLRSLPETTTTAHRAIEVARRTGETAAEVNARINLFTFRSRLEDLPSPDEMSELVELALAAGSYDEGVRASVNYLWTASLVGHVEQTERVVSRLVSSLEHGLASQSYRQYLQLSLATLVWIPAGRWAEADEALARSEIEVATNRLVWWWLRTGHALRRGRLQVVDRELPAFRATALATDEPQRIMPMVAVALPRAALADDTEELERLVDVAARQRPSQFSSTAISLPIVRSLGRRGDRALLEAVRDVWRGAPETVGGVAERAATAWLAGLAGDDARAAPTMAAIEQELRAQGRRYDAACLALDLADAYERARDAAAAGEARSRAKACLDALGCVNPY